MDQTLDGEMEQKNLLEKHDKKQFKIGSYGRNWESSSFSSGRIKADYDDDDDDDDDDDSVTLFVTQQRSVTSLFRKKLIKT